MTPEVVVGEQVDWRMVNNNNNKEVGCEGGYLHRVALSLTTQSTFLGTPNLLSCR